MGGMAAFIPSKDATENQQILAKVRADKTLERDNGHDGTWIAHPGLADTVREVFVDGMAADNQLQVLRDQDNDIDQALLLQPCEGERTEAGMRTNIRVSLQYIAAWLDGKGCVPIYGLMEDAATAEISRLNLAVDSPSTDTQRWHHCQQTAVPRLPAAGGGCGSPTRW